MIKDTVSKNSGASNVMLSLTFKFLFEIKTYEFILEMKRFKVKFKKLKNYQPYIWCTTKKRYENIAANLITHVSKIALKEYAELACVSLKPKSKIAQHYIDKYDMNITGQTLSIELPEILNLIKKYDHDE